MKQNETIDLKGVEVAFTNHMTFNVKFFNCLDRGTQHLIEWQYRLGGDFNHALFELCCRADEGNLYRLSQGFPEEVAAYMKYTRENGWWQKIEKHLFEKESP